MKAVKFLKTWHRLLLDIKSLVIHHLTLSLKSEKGDKA